MNARLRSVWAKGPKASSSNNFPAISLHKPAHWRTSVPTFPPSSKPPPLYPSSTPPPILRYLQSCLADPHLLPPSYCPLRSYWCLLLFNSSHHHQLYHGGSPKTVPLIERHHGASRRHCVTNSASSRSRCPSLDRTKCLSSRKQSGWRRSLSTHRRI